jgi:uncharacterized cupredoxin-like copper-binding protein
MTRARVFQSRTAAGLILALVLGACGGPGTGTSEHTVAYIPGYSGSSPGPAAEPLGFAPHRRTITVALGETDAQHMYIHMSQTVASQGKVSFVVTNEGIQTHEFVVLSTDTPAADLPIVSFEGEANRIDEDAKGVTNVGETGDMEPGTSMVLTVDLEPGHYAVVCNLPVHYAMGMHQDLWVTPTGATPVTVTLGETDAQNMFIDLSSTAVPSGPTSFIVTNTGTQTHEFVVLSSETPAAEFPIVSFEGEANRIDEDAKGVTNVGETGDMEPSAVMLLTIDLSAGHYAVVCNLPVHYAMGMHQDFFATAS